MNPWNRSLVLTAALLLGVGTAWAENPFVRAARIISRDIGPEPNDVARTYRAGDPITVEITYGRAEPDDPPGEEQFIRVELLLSTDGVVTPLNSGALDNTSAHTLWFFESTGAESNSSVAFESTRRITVMLPGNLSGTFFVIPRCYVVRGKGDSDTTNNVPGVSAIADARLTLLPSNYISVSRLSQSEAGVEANELSESPSMSHDGRYVAFASEAGNLVPTLPNLITGRSQIYVRDTVTGSLVLVSQRGGVAGNAPSRNPRISGDGRWIVFESEASNLVPAGTDINLFSDIFLYDRNTGAISLVSKSSSGVQGNSGSFRPSVNTDGTVIVFESTASNLVPNDSNGVSDVFALDVGSGTLTRVSVSALGFQANAGSFEPSVSGDGRYVAFSSSATNLMPGISNGLSQIYIVDRTTNSLIMASRSTSGLVGNSASHQPMLNGDGRYVVFVSASSNLVASPSNPTRLRQVYRLDRDTDNDQVFDEVGAVDLEMVSVRHDLAAPGNDYSVDPVISNDGRFVGFRSMARNLQQPFVVRSDFVTFDTFGERYTLTSDIPGNSFDVPFGIYNFTDLRSFADVYVRDMGRPLSGFTITNPGSGYLYAPEVQITGGGGSGAVARAVVNLDTGQLTRVDIINPGLGYTSTPVVTLSGGEPTTPATAVAQVATHSTRVSVNKFGYETTGVIGDPAVAASRGVTMSSDGRYLAFVSDANGVGSLLFGASNNQPLDTNGKRDVFYIDRQFLTSITIPPGNPPAVSATVSASAVTSNSAILVSGQAFDSDGSIATLEIFANGRLLGVATPGTPSASFTTVFSPGGEIGLFQIVAVATDNDGNRIFSTPVSVTSTLSSNAPPTVTSFTALPLTVSLGQPVDLSVVGSDSDGTVVQAQFFANGLPVGTDTTAPFTVSFTPTVTGPIDVLAVITDNSGNTAVSSSITLTVTPLVPPLATLVTPADNSTVVTVGDTVTLRATAVPQSLGATIASVRFLSGSTVIAAGRRDGASNDFVGTWSPTLAQVGTVSIAASVTDSFDQTATTVSRLVTVQLPPGPLVTLVRPVAGGETATIGTPIFLAAEALPQAPPSVVTAVNFTLGNGTVVPATRVGFSNTFQASYTPVLADLGTLTVSASATDNRGTTTVSSVRSVSVNPVVGVPPTITLAGLPGTPATLTSVSSTLFYADAFDSDGTIASVEFFLNGVSFGVGVPSVRGNRYRSPVLSFLDRGPGSYAVQAVASDSSGNRVASNTLTLTVESASAAAPTAGAVTVTPSNPLAGRLASLGATAAPSPGSTISTVRFFADGELAGTASGAPFITGWTPVTAGVVTVFSEVVDSASNRVISPQAAIAVGMSLPPVVTMLNPSIGDTATVGTPLFLEAESVIQTTGATLASARFTLGSGAVLPAVLDADGRRFRATFVPSSTDLGILQITPSVTDSAGNTASGSPVMLNVGATVGVPATITLNVSATSVSATSEVLLSATIIGGSQPVTAVEFFVDGSSLGMDASAPFIRVWRPARAGVASLVAVGTDAVGNQVASPPVTVTVTSSSTPIPVVTLTAPLPNSGIPLDTPFAVQAVASAGSGALSVAEVRFYANGVLVGTDAAAPYSITEPGLRLTNSTLANEYHAIVRDSAGVERVSAVLNVFPVFSNPATDNLAFTAQTFADLGVDSGGSAVLASLASQLNAGNLSRGDLVEQIRADEDYAAVFYSLAAYRAILYRYPTPAELRRLITQFRSVAVPVPGLRTNTTAGIAAVAQDLFTSPEYAVVHGASLPPLTAAAAGPNLFTNVSTVLGRLYADLYGRAPNLVETTRFNSILQTGNLSLGYAPGLGDATAYELQQAFASIRARTNAAVLLVLLANIAPTNADVASLAALATNEQVADITARQTYAQRFPAAPVITSISPSRFVSVGDPVTLSVTTSGAGPFTFRWRRNGIDVPGGTTSTLVLPAITPSQFGVYTVEVTNSRGVSALDYTSVAPSPLTGRLVNLSARTRVGSGADVLIPGFVIGGTEPKQVLLRAVGPSLGSFGVPGTLERPRLSLFRGSQQLTSSIGWSNVANVTEVQRAFGRVGAFNLLVGSNDSALLATLEPGAYTAVVDGGDGGTGEVLVEVYEFDPTLGGRLANIAARGRAGGPSSPVITGFVVGGNGGRRVLLRAIGPGLSQFGVPGALGNPRIELRQGNTIVAANTGWTTAANAAEIASVGASVGAFPLSTGDADSAILTGILPSGAYTIHVFSPSGASGVVLVEVFDVP